MVASTGYHCAGPTRPARFWPFSHLIIISRCGLPVSFRVLEVCAQSAHYHEISTSTVTDDTESRKQCKKHEGATRAYPDN